jgi:hypothetical protein
MKYFLGVILSCIFLGSVFGQTDNTYVTPKVRVLVITKTNGYRHQAIPAALKALKEIGQDAKWGITSTEDTSLVTPEFLQHFDVIVFLMTTHTIFTDAEHQAIESAVEGGKGLVTLHTGADTEYNWPWYNHVLGAKFLGHPPVQPGRLVIEDHTNPATAVLPEHEWRISDEWYSYDRDPRPDVHVLISIDESSYNTTYNPWFPKVKLPMGDHPVVWTSHSGKGRVFQSAIGHPAETWDNPTYRAFVRGAIEWTAASP